MGKDQMHGSMLCREAAMASGQDDTDADDANPRKCTDVSCLCLFLAYIGAMIHMYMYALEHGNIAKLTHGIDWQGKICGLDEGVEHSPMLYWCKAGVGGVTDGICVESCPTSDETSHMCPGVPVQKQQQSTPDANGQFKVTVTLEREVTKMQDQATTNMMEMYCFPDASGEELQAILSQGQMGGSSQTIMMALHGIYERRWFLTFMAVFSVFASFAFLWFLSTFVKLIMLSIVAICGSLFFVPAAYVTYGISNPEYNYFTSWSGGDDAVATKYATYTAGVLWVLVFIYVCMVCCSWSAFRTTIRTIKECCRTLRAMPSIVIGPVFQVLLKAILFVGMLNGIGWVASMGTVGSGSPPMDNGTGMTVSGVGRELKFSDWQRHWVIFFCFGCLWIHEVVVAWGQMAISHAVVMFELNRDEAHLCLPLTRGYINAFVYHLGTLAFGGFVIGVLTALTSAASFIAKSARNPDGTPNRVTQVACMCCSCCLGCLTEIMDFTNELAYVDCVIEGTCYVSACKNAVKMVVEHTATVAMAAGMGKAVRFLGTLVIGGVGTFFAHFVLTNPWVIGSMSGNLQSEFENSPAYADNVLGSTVAAAMICFGVGGAFMVSFDQIGDTIAFCMLWRRECGVDDDDHFKEMAAEKDHDDNEENDEHHGGCSIM